jgi:hypothetical protein
LPSISAGREDTCPNGRRRPSAGFTVGVLACRRIIALSLEIIDIVNMERVLHGDACYSASPGGGRMAKTNSNEVRHYGQCYYQHRSCTTDEAKSQQTGRRSRRHHAAAQSRVPAMRTSRGKPYAILPAQSWPSGRSLTIALGEVAPIPDNDTVSSGAVTHPRLSAGVFLEGYFRPFCFQLPRGDGDDVLSRRAGDR